MSTPWGTAALHCTAIDILWAVLAAACRSFANLSRAECARKCLDEPDCVGFELGLGDGDSHVRAHLYAHGQLERDRLSHARGVLRVL